MRYQPIENSGLIDARLITGDARLDIQVPRPPDFVPDDTPAAAEEREASAGGNSVGSTPTRR